MIGTLLFDDIDNEFGIITDSYEINDQGEQKFVYVTDWQKSGPVHIHKFQLDNWIEQKRFEVCDIPGDK